MMASEASLKLPLPSITERIIETYDECGAIHHLGHCPLPSYREIVDILEDSEGDPLSRLRPAPEFESL